MLRSIRLTAALLLPLALTPLASGQGFASDVVPSTTIGVEPVITAQPSAKLAGDAASLEATWEGSPQWLEGAPFSGAAFGGGVYYGRDWFSRSVISPEADFPVRIEFTESISTQARIWRRDLGYADGGIGTFFGAAYDISDPLNPRRLNVGFVEDDSFCGIDSQWNPTDEAVGCREYLYIMRSDYDGNGQSYAGRSPFDSNFDLVYAVAPRVPTGRTLYESDPASLTLTFPPLRFAGARVTGNGAVEISAHYNPVVEIPSGSTIRFTFAPDGGPTLQIGTTYPAGDSPLAVLGSLDGLDRNLFYTFTTIIQDQAGTVLHSSASTRLKPALSRNTELLGVWDERGSWSDVWGYTSPSGTEYALVALQNFGMSVIDITGVPVEVGFIPTASGASDSKDVKVIGKHAYLINENGPVQIIDLTDPTNPVQVGTLDTQIGISGSGAHNVYVDDEYLYVTGGRTSGNAGLRMYSVEDPTSPVLVSQYRPDHFASPYYHDFYTVGDLGYGPNIYGGGVDILDLSDPRNPQRISTFGYPGSGAHNVCGTADGAYVYIGDEIGSAGNWTRIFDVRDPLNVEFIGDIIIDSEAVVHNCYVVGDLLHIGHYTEGYHVFDVSDPTAPTQVAFYDTFLDTGYGYNGVWSIYPYFESGKIAVSDRNGGLFIVTLDGSVTTTEAPSEADRLEIIAGPNPASGAVQMRAHLTTPGTARLSVVDARGREVAVLHDGEASGVLRATLNAESLAPGLYIIRLDASGVISTQTITVVR